MERLVRPVCWVRVSEDQGGSRVMCTRLRRFKARPRSACREMPLEAALEMMATSLLPLWKQFFSSTFTSLVERL